MFWQKKLPSPFPLPKNVNKQVSQKKRQQNFFFFCKIIFFFSKKIYRIILVAGKYKSEKYFLIKCTPFSLGEPCPSVTFRKSGLGKRWRRAPPPWQVVSRRCHLVRSHLDDDGQVQADRGEWWSLPQHTLFHPALCSVFQGKHRFVTGHTFQSNGLQ